MTESLGSERASADLALAPTGTVAHTYPRAGARTINVGILTSGTLHLTACYIPAGTVVTNISYMSAGTGATNPTNWWFGLYDSARLGLRLTADQTTTAWGSSTVKTVALSSAFTTTYSGLHYVGIMMAAATPITLHGVDATGTGPPSLAPILHGNSTTGLTAPPAPSAAGGVGGTAGAITTGAAGPYAWLT
jgi:hypothetical protein